jgi:hypothetical protein
MTKKFEPNIDPNAPQEVKDGAALLSDQEKREIAIMGAMRNAVYKLLEEDNNTVIIDLAELVRVHAKCIGYYMGMAEMFDDVEFRAEYLSGMASFLMREVEASREAFTSTPLPPNVTVIDDSMGGSASQH